MSVMEKTIRLRGSRGERRAQVLFDSGATYSCVKPDLAAELANLEPLPDPMEFGPAEDDHQLKATQRISIDFYIDKDRFSDEFMVIEGLAREAIIGASTLQKWRMNLDFDRDEIVYDPKVTRLQII